VESMATYVQSSLSTVLYTLYGSDTYREVITKGVQILSSIQDDDGEHEGEYPFLLRLNGTRIPH